MSSPFNDNNKKSQKMNNKKLNRSTVITIITLAIAIIIVATAAIISNRSQAKDPLPSSPSSEAPTQKPSSTDAPTEEPTDTEKPTQSATNSSQVSNKIPSFILPVSGVLSSKHNPELQVFSPTMNDYRVHLGIDLVTKDNAPVYAAADGKISKIWVDTKMGYCIAITHSGNCVTVYKNLSEELPAGIAEGKSVRSGQLIATVGDSAMIEVGEEPHLHFEMTVSELAVDPLKYFDEAALESIKADTTHES